MEWKGFHLVTAKEIAKERGFWFAWRAFHPDSEMWPRLQTNMSEDAIIIQWMIV